MKIHPVGVMSSADRWTENHDEATSHFPQLSCTHTSKGDWNRTA